MEARSEPTPPCYDAFISYSRGDAPFARALEEALEAYRPPRDLSLPDRRLEIFRDERDLTGSDYFRSIEEHLESAAKLIVVCSPAARASQYVDDEIRRFARLRGARNIIPVLLSGVPNNEAAAREDQNAFPEALCEVLELPLAIVYRGFRARKDRASRGVFEGAWYSILASLYDLSRDVLEQRDRIRQLRQRRVRAAIVSAVVVALAVLAAVAWLQKGEADQQRHAAELRLAGSLWDSARREREQGNVPLALHLMARAVEAAPEMDLARIIMQDAAADADSVVLVKPLEVPGLGWETALACGDRTYVVTAEQESPGDDAFIGRIRLVDADTGQPVGTSFLVAVAPDSLLLRLDGACDPLRLWLSTLDSTEQLGGTVQVFDFESGSRYERELAPGTFAGAHSPDLDRFVLHTGDNTFSIETVSTGRSLGPFRVAWGQGISFSRDGSRIVVAGGDGGVQLRHAETGEEIANGFRHEDGVAGAVLAPNNRWLLTWGESSDARLWDTGRPDAEGRTLPDSGDLRGARFSPDSQRLLTWNRNHEARVWSTGSAREPTPALVHSARERDPMFSPDARFVLTSTEAGHAVLWDADSGARAATFYTADATLFFAADGRRILALDGQAVRWWDASALWRRSERLQLGGVAERVGLSAARDRLWIELSGASLVQLWDVETGARISEVGYRTAERHGLVSGTNDRAVLWPAPRSAGKGASLLDVKTLQPIASLEHEARIEGAELSRDEELVLTWSEDRMARVWSVSTGDRIGMDMMHDQPMRGGLVSGGRVLTWGGEPGARLWDVLTGKPVATLDPDADVAGAVIAEARGVILTWSQAGTARLWSATDGAPIGDRLEHGAQVQGAAPGPDEESFLTWCDDGSVRVWDWPARERATIRTDLRIDSAELSPDLKRVLVCQRVYPGSASLWDVTSGKSIARFEIPHLAGCAGFTRDQNRVVTWDSRGVQFWYLAGDLDFPADKYRLRVEALTGTRFDPVGFEARPLALDEWKKVQAEYLEVDRLHAKSCAYPEENLYRRFFAADDPEPETARPPAPVQ